MASQAGQAFFDEPFRLVGLKGRQAAGLRLRDEQRPDDGEDHDENLCMATKAPPKGQRKTPDVFR